MRHGRARAAWDPEVSTWEQSTSLHSPLPEPQYHVLRDSSRHTKRLMKPGRAVGPHSPIAIVLPSSVRKNGF